MEALVIGPNQVLEIILTNEHGEKYTYRPDPKNLADDVTEDQIMAMVQDVAAVGVSRPGSTNQRWGKTYRTRIVDKKPPKKPLLLEVKNNKKMVKRQIACRAQAALKEAKTVLKTFFQRDIADVLAAAVAAEPKKRPKSNNWVITMKDVESKPFSKLMAILKQYILDDGLPTNMVSSLLMADRMYKSGVYKFEEPEKHVIGGDDLVKMLLIIFDTMEIWNRQVIQAFKAFRHLFNRDVRRAYQVEMERQEKLLNKTELAESINEVAAEELSIVTAEDEAVVAETVPKKKYSKKERALLEKYGDQPKQKKKSRMHHWFKKKK